MMDDEDDDGDDDGQWHMWQKSLAALFVEKKCHSGFSFDQKDKTNFSNCV
jgi:hypothetical protein